jgi:hypothetical protein
MFVTSQGMPAGAAGSLAGAIFPGRSSGGAARLYVADTIRAHFPTLGIAEGATLTTLKTKTRQAGET